MNAQPTHDSNPLHGVTLERMLNELVEHLGWERMARQVKIACFTTDPSVSSSLKFLRRTPWARAKVEAMFLESRARKQQHDARKATAQSVRPNGSRSAPSGSDETRSDDSRSDDSRSDDSRSDDSRSDDSRSDDSRSDDSRSDAPRPHVTDTPSE